MGGDSDQTIRRLEDRLRVLSRALRAFAEATADWQQLLEVVARTVAEVIGDGCVVRLQSEDGALVPAAVHLPFERRVSDASVIARVRAHVMAPHNLGEQPPARRVFETGEALLVPELDLEQLRAHATAEIADAFRTIGIHSLLIAALRVRGESIGLLSLVRFAPESPPFSDGDRDLAQALADHAALAITNARLLDQAKRAIGIRDQFLSIASHELRTPLTSLTLQLSGLSRVVRGGDGPSVPRSTLQDRVAVMDQQATRLTSLVDELLDVSRISSGRLTISPERVDIVPVVREVVNRLSIQAERAGCTTRVDAPDSVVGWWDRNRLDQVITNIVSNAIKYAGGKPIEMAVTQAATSVAIAVRDYGPGISKVDQERIFGQFERAAPPALAGLGLGLWIASRIVDAHEGRIEVASQVGEGATFTVHLPLRLAA